MSNVKLTGFGDEIASSLDEQLALMEALGIRALEARGVNGVNVSALTEAQARAARATLDAHGFEVSALGSPIGKSDIGEDFGKALDALRHTLDIARILRAPAIRLFSFYVPDASSDDRGDEVLSRLSRFKEAAAGSGITLLHENESGIFGETPAHCLRIARQLCGEGFALIFDPSNFVQRGWDVMAAWRLLKPYVRYLHIKDSVRLPEGTDIHAVNPHRVAGTGEARLRSILSDLKADGYAGYLSLEPHLAGSAFVSGTRAGKWAAAALALQALLDETGIKWQREA